MTAGSKHIHVIQVHYKRKWYFDNNMINLLRKGLTQEVNLDGGSILWAPALCKYFYVSVWHVTILTLHRQDLKNLQFSSVQFILPLLLN